MSKTAQRRHEHFRHMRRRLRTPRWAWVERDPKLSDADRAMLRNKAARHTTTCSCYLCRCVRIDAARHKAAQTVTAADWRE